MPFEEFGICSDGHTISGFPSTWRGEKEKASTGEKLRSRSRIANRESTVWLQLSQGLIIQDQCVC